jgi:serine-type D-Ala-D-Ala carboxypeptidase
MKRAGNSSAELSIEVEEVARETKGRKRLRELIAQAASNGVFPGAVFIVALKGRVVFHEALGHRSIVPEKMPMNRDTVFDLASLTKPLATTICMMKLVNEEKSLPDQSLSEIIPNAVLGNKELLTLRLLLTHSAGLIGWKPFYEKLIDYPPSDRRRILRRWIIEEPFAYEPGKGNLYSDLGFMLLEWVIEEKTGETLPEFAQKYFYGPLGLKRTFFRGTSEGENSRRNPPRLRLSKGVREEFAATEDCPWRKKVLQGEVHDDNAWTLGGYSAHAGLFGTAEEAYIIANMLREHYLGIRRDFFKPGTVREFFRRQNIVEGSDWALGWDTRAIEGSSAGKHFFRDSVGHTGFTGTSIWMDLQKDVIAVLLTNRVHPKRDNDRIKQFRPVFHDAVMEELGLAD